MGIDYNHRVKTYATGLSKGGEMPKVKIVRASDGYYRLGKVVKLTLFLESVKYALLNGGEMPIAQLVPD